MITTYLRFPSQEVWEQAAAAVGVRVNNPTLIEEESIDPDTGDIIPAVYEDNWSWSYYTHDWAVDVIGIITEGGEWDEDDNEIVAPTVLPGWHVNYFGELPTGWEQFEVTPTTPLRVFA